MDGAFLCFEGFGVGLVAEFLFETFPRCWSSLGDGFVSWDKFAGGPAEDVADSVVDVDAVDLFGVFAGPAEEGKGTATHGGHGAGFGEVILASEEIISGRDVGVASWVSGDIAVGEHDVVAFIDEFQVGVADLLDAFPEEAAPEPRLSGSWLLRADD